MSEWHKLQLLGDASIAAITEASCTCHSFDSEVGFTSAAAIASGIESATTATGKHMTH